MNVQKYKKLIFGIVGYGSIGRVHEKILNQLQYENFIFDPNLKNKKNKISLLEMKNKCNIIIISSPSYTHYDYIKFFSKEDKHIFIEKPFSHEIKKTEKIIKFYKKKKKIIAVNYNLRSRDCIVSLKKILKKKVKKIFWSNFLMSSNVLKWRKNYKFESNYTHHKIAGGIAFDSIHEIDLNFFLFKNLKFLNSNNLNFNKNLFKKSSFSSINLLIKNKFLSSIQLDYRGNPDQRKINILTDIGLIQVDIKKNIINIYNKNNKIIYKKTYNKNKFNDYKKMIVNFISCIKNPHKKLICGPDEAIKNVKIALKVNA